MEWLKTLIFKEDPNFQLRSQCELSTERNLGEINQGKRIVVLSLRSWHLYSTGIKEFCVIKDTGEEKVTTGRDLKMDPNMKSKIDKELTRGKTSDFMLKSGVLQGFQEEQKTQE